MPTIHLCFILLWFGFKFESFSGSSFNFNLHFAFQCLVFFFSNKFKNIGGLLSLDLIDKPPSKYMQIPKMFWLLKIIVIKKIFSNSHIKTWEKFCADIIWKCNWVRIYNFGYNSIYLKMPLPVHLCLNVILGQKYT